MKEFIIGRLLTMIPVMVLVTIISFSLILLLPGDPAMFVLGGDVPTTPEAYEKLREELGLNRPIPIQYADWLWKAARGDLGRSVRTNQPITRLVLERLPVTVELSIVTMFLALIVAVPAGILSAVRPNSKLDVMGTLFVIGGVGIPHFWLGILLILIFGVWLRWLPPSGFVEVGEDLGMNLKLMILPAITLTTGIIAVVMRQTRSSLIEVMQHDYIITARAKGLREQAVVTAHALKNALIPVVTVVGLQGGRLLGGAVIVETVFGLPGIGRMSVDAIYARDFPIVQGVILIMAVAVLMANFLTDIAYVYLDPRIRYQ